MKQPVIWFNKGLSSTVYVLQTIKEAQRACENFRIVTSHTRLVPAAEQSDVFALEPPVEGSDQYVQWCLDFARAHAVDVFIPRNYAQALADAQARFAEQGVRLVVAGDSATLSVIKSKAALYQFVGSDLVPQPDFRVAGNVDEFDAAVAELAKAHETVCFKPTQGIAGKGFKILAPQGKVITSPWDGEVISSTIEEARLELQAKSPFPEQMVMEFMTGLERSVDCLAHNGELVCGITRLKSLTGIEELIEENPELLEYCRRLTRKLKLNGLFNVQFMESKGRQYLLEINARMSGGIHFGAFSGVSLPYWAIRLALGTAVPADVPQPRTGIRIERATRAVLQQ